MLSMGMCALWNLLACVMLMLAATTSGQQADSLIVQQQEALQAACKVELRTFCHMTSVSNRMQGAEAAVCLIDHHDRLGPKCLALLEGDHRRRLTADGPFGNAEQTEDHAAPVGRSLHTGRLAWLQDAAADLVGKIKAFLSSLLPSTIKDQSPAQQEIPKDAGKDGATDDLILSWHDDGYDDDAYGYLREITDDIVFADDEFTHSNLRH